MIRRSQETPAAPWVVTLNDLTFLLLVFFILFFAMGLADRSRFERFREAFAGTSRPSPPGGAEGNPEVVAGGTRILKSRGSELRVERTGEGTRVQLSAAIGGFAEGEWGLPPQAGAAVSEVAEWLKGRSNLVVLRGHAAGNAADAESGDPWLLSARRANEVRKALVAAGVEPSRLRVRGEGPGAPLGDPADAAGRARNRRVDVVVTSETAGE